MTIRALFNRKKGWIMAFAITGFALATTGVVLAQQNLLNYAPYHALLPGAGLSLLAFLYAQLLAFRCPRCYGSWGPLAMQGSRSLFRIDNRIRYCPFCGCDIDSDSERRLENDAV